MSYDYQRDFVLNSLGLKVLRIKNDELVDIDAVLKKILEFGEGR
jgi:very-short-patch-repair endonuclease